MPGNLSRHTAEWGRNRPKSRHPHLLEMNSTPWVIFSPFVGSQGGFDLLTPAVVSSPDSLNAKPGSCIEESFLIKTLLYKLQFVSFYPWFCPEILNVLAFLYILFWFHYLIYYVSPYLILAVIQKEWQALLDLICYFFQAEHSLDLRINLSYWNIRFQVQS